MKTTGVSDIPKFGLLDFLGHPTVHARTLLILPAQSQVSSTRQETQYFCKTHDQTKVIERINNIKSSENENTISLFTLNCRLLGVIWYPIVKSLLPQNQNLVNDHELSAMWVLCDRFRFDVITMWRKNVFLWSNFHCTYSQQWPGLLRGSVRRQVNGSPVPQCAKNAFAMPECAKNALAIVQSDLWSLLVHCLNQKYLEGGRGKSRIIRLITQCKIKFTYPSQISFCEGGYHTLMSSEYFFLMLWRQNIFEREFNDGVVRILFM